MRTLPTGIISGAEILMEEADGALGDLAEMILLSSTGNYFR